MQTGLPATRWLPDVPPISDAAPWLVEFRIGLRSHPGLAEHGFHDMAVLPGAFHIALVRKIHRAFFYRDAVNLRHIEFEKPVILSDDDITLTVRIDERGSEHVRYELFEATGEHVRNSPAAQPCARLQVDLNPATLSHESTPVPINADEFPAHSIPLGSADDFYRKLRGNGNQYGPHFQTLADIRQCDFQIAARFTAAASNTTESAGFFSPPLLDAASQLLSAFTLDRGHTFILKSIEHLTVSSPEDARPARAVASRMDSAANEDALLGSVKIFAGDGTLLCEFSGVTLAFIERPVAAELSSAEETLLCIASTFTAEPLEDSLKFWGAHFGRKVRVDFAPYNQVFQELLDPASAFHRNRDGINLLVLGIEDWLHADRSALLSTDPARVSASFGDRPRHTLPGGIEIVHLNRYETDYVWQEIFGDESYLRHGIRLEDGDTVVDIGANIGLFSLFVMSRCKAPTIYAFEPSPRVFDLLQANCAAYGDPARVRAFNCGVAEKKGSASFTFYEHSSVFSSFHPDENEDRAAVQAVVRNVLQNELPGPAHDADIEDLTTARLRAETIECPLTSVSDIIRENHIAHVHLLKIDAEKSELGILRGIEEAHWPLIEQIVIEVHDRTRAAVQSIEEELTRRGFRCAVVEEKLLEQSGLFNVYATRRAPSAVVQNAADGLQRKAGEFCTALDTFAASSRTPLILAIAPRSPGTADAALYAAEQQMLARAACHPHIRSIASREIFTRYPVREWHDAHSHQLGHMPFTQEGYAAIGTALFRTVFNVGAPPVKVIVLDCDNTLWQGLCGEDGPAGILIPPGFRGLQEFMIAQTQAGVLLALCSKNQEADVLAVFDQRGDMPLRREHLAGWRINWETKPDNLRALAAQFDLGLDSFVFLDDNPVECAAVRAGCPEVIVLQLPQEQERIPAFLESVWIFDRASATREDRERSQWYQTNADREELRTAAPTLRDFLDGLQLHIEVTEATDDQLSRVAQLTMRTNQFNLTSIRRTEAEIRDLLKSGATCLVTSVSDRFGDYGLVGVILCTTGADRCTVDTMLLSCRALGKGVEHRMIAELAGRSLHEGKAVIELPYRRTDRNEPAREFLSRLGTAQDDSDFTLALPAMALASLRYDPSGEAKPAHSEKSALAKNSATSSSGIVRANFSSAMQQLGDEFNTIQSVVAAMESSRRRAQPVADQNAPEMMEGVSALERSLATIWQKALGRTRIGSTENFFDAGGTSLKAVVVVATIRRELKMNVSIITLFECPTIKLLAAKLGGSTGTADDTSAASTSAESRGRQRRHKLIKRRVA